MLQQGGGGDRRRDIPALPAMPQTRPRRVVPSHRIVVAGARGRKAGFPPACPTDSPLWQNGRHPALSATRILRRRRRRDDDHENTDITDKNKDTHDDRNSNIIEKTNHTNTNKPTIEHVIIRVIGILRIRLIRIRTTSSGEREIVCVCVCGGFLEFFAMSSAPRLGETHISVLP